MSLDLFVEKFRAAAHVVHQGDSSSDEWRDAVDEMKDLWMVMTDGQRRVAIRGYEWMWIPPVPLPEWRDVAGSREAWPEYFK